MGIGELFELEKTGNIFPEQEKAFSNAKEIIEIYGIVHSETEMAIYVDVGNNTVWLPKSQLEDWPEVGDSGDVLMPMWLAKEKEII